MKIYKWQTKMLKTVTSKKPETTAHSIDYPGQITQKSIHSLSIFVDIIQYL